MGMSMAVAFAAESVLVSTGRINWICPTAGTFLLVFTVLCQQKFEDGNSRQPLPVKETGGRGQGWS